MKKKKKPQTAKLPHPMQPIGWDAAEYPVIRFKENKIVRKLFAQGGLDMNAIVLRLLQGGFSKEDYTQFVQLIGYSVGGAGDLSNFSRKTIAAADEQAELLRKSK